MSKLSKLKQEAYLAGKKRNWDDAISIYEKILDLDKNNPALINELGDICLKVDNVKRAVSLFLSAATKYASAGLSNNAVAVYKKVLRHDDENWNAHWFLAKLRAEQGLVVEGCEHAEQFLSSSSSNSPEFKEIFLKRCQELMGLYQENEAILIRLAETFNLWNLALEAARCNCLLACVQYSSGKEDDAKNLITQMVGAVPEIVNYTEYSKWQNLIDPSAATATSVDVNAIDLDSSPKADPPAVPADPPVAVDPPAPAPVVETVAESSVPTEDLDLAAALDGVQQTSFSTGPLDEPGDESSTSVPEFEIPIDGGADDLDIEVSVNRDPESTFEDVEKDDEGCIQIDLGDDSDQTESANDLAGAIDSIPDTPAEKPASAGVQGSAADEKPVDLLAEILAEDSGDNGDQDANQVNTIASEIGQQVGASQDGGPDQQYEMGLVYLEMGMYDQAGESFAAAAEDREFAIRSFEMWGITLQRAGRIDQAIETFAKGLSLPDIGEDEQLGLLYHTGRAYEEDKQVKMAVEFYEKVAGISSSFLDVNARLGKLAVIDS